MIMIMKLCGITELIQSISVICCHKRIRALHYHYIKVNLEAWCEASWQNSNPIPAFPKVGGHNYDTVTS
jgi:hypothetical protein